MAVIPSFLPWPTSLSPFITSNRPPLPTSWLHVFLGMHCAAPLKKHNGVVETHSSIELMIPIASRWAKTQVLIILDSRTRFHAKILPTAYKMRSAVEKTWLMTLLVTGTLSLFICCCEAWGGGGWGGNRDSPPAILLPLPSPLGNLSSLMSSPYSPPPLFLETLTLPHTPLEDVSKYSAPKVQGCLLVKCTNVMWISLP